MRLDPFHRLHRVAKGLRTLLQRTQAPLGGGVIIHQGGIQQDMLPFHFQIIRV